MIGFTSRFGSSYLQKVYLENLWISTKNNKWYAIANRTMLLMFQKSVQTTADNNTVNTQNVHDAYDIYRHIPSQPRPFTMGRGNFHTDLFLLWSLFQLVRFSDHYQNGSAHWNCEDHDLLQLTWNGDDPFKELRRCIFSGKISGSSVFRGFTPRGDSSPPFLKHKKKTKRIEMIECIRYINWRR